MLVPPLKYLLSATQYIFKKSEISEIAVEFQKIKKLKEITECYLCKVIREYKKYEGSVLQSDQITP